MSWRRRSMALPRQALLRGPQERQQRWVRQPARQASRGQRVQLNWKG